MSQKIPASGCLCSGFLLWNTKSKKQDEKTQNKQKSRTNRRNRSSKKDKKKAVFYNKDVHEVHSCRSKDKNLCVCKITGQ